MKQDDIRFLTQLARNGCWPLDPDYLYKSALAVVIAVVALFRYTLY